MLLCETQLQQLTIPTTLQELLLLLVVDAVHATQYCYTVRRVPDTCNAAWLAASCTGVRAFCGLPLRVGLFILPHLGSVGTGFVAFKAQSVEHSVWGFLALDFSVFQGENPPDLVKPF